MKIKHEIIVTYGAFEGSLRGVHLSDVTIEVVGPWEQRKNRETRQSRKFFTCCECVGNIRSAALPGESLSTVGANVGFLHAALVGAHVVAHAVLPLEALLADGTGERLLV